VNLEWKLALSVFVAMQCSFFGLSILYFEKNVSNAKGLLYLIGILALSLSTYVHWEFYKNFNAMLSIILALSTALIMFYFLLARCIHNPEQMIAIAKLKRFGAFDSFMLSILLNGITIMGMRP
jgi:uncharacterized membrane protein YfcA